MCGIVGAAARRDVVGTLIDGLKALEYRGYDSAGIALLTDRGLERVRTKGKVRELEQLHASQPIAGFTGIAHTRWATHGAPNTVNAHPIASRDTVAVVHNGIIENHEELRTELKALGFVFATETDTEVIAHLVEHYHSAGADLLNAVRSAIARLRGAYAIAAISTREPGRVIGARRGSPMVVGLSDGEQFIASDIHALLPVTRRFIYLAEGDVADATIDRVDIYDENGAPVQRTVKQAHFGADAVERGEYRHYMLKEIHEQPQAIADTLAALREAKRLGYLGSFAICNVPESSLVRESDLVLMTRAGPEIGVASTKAFTTQLSALALLVLELARMNGLPQERCAELVAELASLPRVVADVLKIEPEIAKLAERFVSKHHALFLGRGANYPVALEGALKLKEISYIHAEGYPAGELKHGPLALVDEDMPVVTVAPNNQLLEKLKSNLEEVRARGGELFVFADRAVEISERMLESDGRGAVVRIDSGGNLIAPAVFTVPLQLLAYHVAVLRGTDVDQPRNLAKSVTVE